MRRRMIVCSILVSLFLINVFVFCHKDNDGTYVGTTFADPHQISQFVLYGSDNNKFTIYEPVTSVEESKVGSDLLNKANFRPLKGKDIFDYDKNLLFVGEVEDESGDILQHIQQQYIVNDGWDFIIFSAYEIKGFNMDLYDKNKDIFGNKVNIYKINGEKVVQVELSNKGLNYYYYIYDKEDKDNNLYMGVTRANEIFTYQNGILYYVAYTIDVENDTILDILDNFIK
ncbi:hypothetical protein SH1V18_31570 [Vallitalea longa]|uniref:Uncharacterized protein n=1 Tax=Vallitalea longa TaxID=2936439 RepID=A0A9W6DGM0_9FIRM|nr:hypothetical protein [Vallitalea longa]GKX30677.1 hypothetical protein SH1V18_31570 [Vallitalea longa]